MGRSKMSTCLEREREREHQLMEWGEGKGKGKKIWFKWTSVLESLK